MSAAIRKNAAASGAWTTIHPLSPEDSAAIAALRGVVAGTKGKLEGTAARGPFNDILESVAVPEGLTWQSETVGGTPDWWAESANSKKGDWSCK